MQVSSQSPAAVKPHAFETFAPIPTGPLKRHDLLPSRKLALARLCQYAARRGVAWCGVETLAHEIGMSPSTARRALRDLEAAGLVLTCLRQGRSSVYRVVGAGHPGHADRQRDKISDLDLIPSPALEDFKTEGPGARLVEGVPRMPRDASAAPAPAPDSPERSSPGPQRLPGRFLGVSWAIWRRVYREHRGRDYPTTPFDGDPMIRVAQATLAAVRYDHAAARELLEHRFVSFLADRTLKLNELGHPVFLLPARVAGYGWPKGRFRDGAPRVGHPAAPRPAPGPVLDLGELGRRAAAWGRS